MSSDFYSVGLGEGISMSPDFIGFGSSGYLHTSDFMGLGSSGYFDIPDFMGMD